eukprot:TRINITY_DN1873_c0_g1_i4.p1 TRINITY_DN1873_c0_g1~~TRINITY_DN1873_c0_g1_i4.p1  ORF type:complete len:819 (-),score=97.80 TRINITY_DN1873_c0_g1_i4:13-2469(-)
MDVSSHSIIFGDLRVELYPLLDCATIVRLAQTFRKAPEVILRGVSQLCLDDSCVAEVSRPSWWCDVIYWLERHSGYLRKLKSITLQVNSAPAVGFDLVGRLKKSTLASIHSFSFRTSRDISLCDLGCEPLASLLPSHLTELNLCRIDIPIKTQREMVALLSSMPALHTVRSVHSLADLRKRSRQEDVLRLKQIGKALSSAARRLKHLVFISEVVSAVSDGFNFSDMPQCIDITLSCDDFASMLDKDRMKDMSKASMALERLLASIPEHLRSTPPRLWYEYITRDPNDHMYWSPLHYMSQRGRPDVLAEFVKIWRQKGWPVDIEDSEGATPLSYTTSVESFGLLVSEGADPFYRSTKNGRTVLLSWCRFSADVTMLEHIMNKYIERNDSSLFVDSSGNGLLHFAFADVFEMLLDRYRSFVDPCLTNNQLQNALFSKVDRWLDDDGKQRAQRLMQAGADPLQPDATGLSAAHHCLSLESVQLAQIYLGAVKTREDLERVWLARPPPYVSSSSDNITFAMRLCRCHIRFSQNYRGWIDEQLNRILMMCTTEELNAVDFMGRTLLHYCLRANGGASKDVLEFLLTKFERRSELDLHAGAEPLLFTAVRVANNCPDIFRTLVDAGLDVKSAPLYRGESLLHYAIRRAAFYLDYTGFACAFDAAVALLGHGADATSSDDISKLTPIHLMCELSLSHPRAFEEVWEFPFHRGILPRLVGMSKSVLATKMLTCRGKQQDTVEILLSSQEPKDCQSLILAEIIKNSAENMPVWQPLILESGFVKFRCVLDALGIDESEDSDDEEDDEDDDEQLDDGPSGRLFGRRVE